MSKNREDAAWCSRTPGSRLFFAAFLIVGGTLLFLGNLGILPLRNVWSYWPVVIVGLGVARLVEAPDLANKLFGAFLSFGGAVFLLINLDVIRIRSRDDSWPFSILLIVGGMSMLIKILQKRDAGKPLPGNLGRGAAADSSNVLSDLCILGSIKRRVDATDFSGGSSLSILGSTELDLRHSRITEPGQIVQIDVSAILGSAKIRVPEHWCVRIRGTSFMGNYEDKTIPQASGSEAPTLVVTGYSILGAVEIED